MNSVVHRVACYLTQSGNIKIGLHAEDGVVASTLYPLYTTVGRGWGVRGGSVAVKHILLASHK